MEYKNFKGSLQWSKEDNLYYGRITNIDDFINYHGKTKEELKESFINAVEDYLEICKELNKNPKFI